MEKLTLTFLTTVFLSLTNCNEDPNSKNVMKTENIQSQAVTGKNGLDGKDGVGILGGKGGKGGKGG